MTINDSSYPKLGQSNVDITLVGDDSTTDWMLVKVKNCILKETGEMIIFNVDLSTLEGVQPRPTK